jgi:hypothetical protein
VILLDEAATGYETGFGDLELEQQPEEVGPPTPEAEFVVDERHSLTSGERP